MAEDEEIAGQRGYGLDRTLALSDGVFAFAITLLVLDLTVPSLVGSVSNITIASALSQELPKFVNYLVSFFVVGIWWNTHRRNFAYIRKDDATLASQNLLFLLCIALTPFFTNLLDAYGSIQLPVALFALVQAAGGSLMTLMWWHASRNHKLISSRMKNGAIRRILIFNSATPAVFLLSVGLSFFVPTVFVQFSWVLLITVLRMLRRHGGTNRNIQ